MSEQVPALLWPERVFPAEIRHLLLATTGLFGAAGLAMTLITASGWRTAAVAGTACLVSVVLTAGHARTRSHPSSPARSTLVLLGSAVLLVTAFTVSGQPTTALATSLPFAFAITWWRPWWLPLSMALLAIWGAAGVTTVARDGQYPASEAITMTVLLGAASIGFAGANVGWVFQRRLDHHHADQRDLALTRERLRFATDLHDIQGHTLLTIKLKAELARRSITRDPERTLEELHAIEALAAEADEHTRDLAQGYRTLNLSAELANAEQLLSAAGIAVTIDRAGTPVPGTDQLFATLAREATSNILRHADASRVRMRLTTTSLAVENDGAMAADDRPRDDSSGLRGLQQRFAGHGGTVSWHRDDAVFCLRGEVGAP